MEKFLIQLGTMSLQAAVIVLVVCLIRALFIKGRISQKYIMLLWIVPFFFMVFPWKVSSPIGFWREHTVMEQLTLSYAENAQVSGDNNGIIVTEDKGAEAMEAQSGETQSEELQSIQAEKPLDVAASALHDTNGSMESETAANFAMKALVVPILFGVWSVGVLVVLGYMLLSILKLKKRLACSICEWENIYVAEDIAVPMVFGIIRPCIYLPTGMDAGQKNIVISHEQTHIMRKDPVKKLIAFLIVGVHWFNPFAWLAFVLLERDMEMACDEETVKRMGVASKQAYATTLLWITNEKGAPNHRLGVPLGFGEVDTKQRIKNILADKKAKQLIAVLVIVLCVVLMAVFLTRQEEVNVASGQTSENVQSESFGENVEGMADGGTEVSAEEIPDVVYAAAENYAKEHFDRVWEEYSKWRIADIAHTYTYEDFYGRELWVYVFDYEFLAIHPEDIVLAGGMSMDEEGWVVPGYPDSMYLIFEKQGEQLVYLATMMENDCYPGEEVFDNDLEHKLLDAGVNIMSEKPIQITRRSITSDMVYGPDGEDLEYADDERLIFRDCYALYVYDLQEGRMLRQIDLTSIGCHYTQGDYYCDVRASADGTVVYLHPIHLSSMYVYDVEKDTLVKKVYEEPKDLWKGYLMTYDYMEKDFTAFTSLFCVEVSQGAYGYLYGGSGLVEDTAWVVRDANEQETFTYLFKEENQQEKLPEIVYATDFTMDMLIELVQGGNTYDEFQQLVWRDGFVYQNFVREASEYSLTWSYFCNMTYRDKEYRMQVAYWKPEEASKYGKESDALSAVYLMEVRSGDMILLYDEEGRFEVNTDIDEFLNRGYDIADYLTIDLPAGISLGDYQMYNNDVFSGCLMLGDYEETPHGDGTTEAWYAPGGVGVANAQEHSILQFENGKLTGVQWQVNHSSLASEGELIEGCDMQALLYEAVFDTFTLPEWEEYKTKYPDASNELATSAYWYVYFGEPNSEMIYVVYFNQEHFTKEEAIAIARTVRLVG